MSGWRPALQARRIGAAHERKGRPCQDAVAVAQCRSRDGRAVQVMAVADGHGGEHYPLSDVGSALACEQALLAVEEHLSATDLEGSLAPDLQAWSHWLGTGLPERIHGQWLARVGEHWRQQATAPEAASPEAISPEAEVPRLYGTTLGLVVMTPRWWGYTGLGDWDLVRMDSNGPAALLSEEEASVGSGEATGSLCLEQAARIFRSGLQLIEAPGASFGLMLSTDGIRKSCATDADFLVLAAHLIATPTAGASEALAANLEQITNEGSGDDVSVTMALHEGLHIPGEEPAALARPPQAWSGLALMPALLGALLLTSAGIGAGWYWLQQRTLVLQRNPAPQPAAAVRRQIRQLCDGPPAAIAGTLSSRRSQFTDLRQGRLSPASLLAAAELDPLGALIAGSFDPATGGMVQGKALTALGLCPLLVTALQRQWPPTSNTIPDPPAR
ncbi:protein phosphatase 2C domain-containing protein [Synechococcus sp. CS-1329]|uniref:protein phosphatase 2C domain-containing protein n=1 Tax=Synechococcus sp. CS-1329 TaxID=2847975 RepID=UPI00223B94EF|nr:protein phosphatase 2C domain-containing protein [Synechococcus sp. CS-1329]MCT0217973.1 protein phosphatase 2C domain-containing protein [Synechococcus sp. CS-1329]